MPTIEETVNEAAKKLDGLSTDKLIKAVSLVFEIPYGSGTKRLKRDLIFATGLTALQKRITNPDGTIMKISSRGWAYLLEQSFALITKADFDRVETSINTCRAKGILPIDFVAQDEARLFKGVEHPNTEEPAEYVSRFLRACIRSGEHYTPDWWDGEDYYIQMVVEKIDLRTLFIPVCEEYHIPIATTKGWSSQLQRATYARRFREAEQQGLTCVLLYCGDFDPDGLRISDFLRNNLQQLSNIRWSDGTRGYDATNLIIDRFGLNYDFIEEQNLTWIDNLITGSKKNLADPSHPNHHMEYVQDYLREYGARKCEANALTPYPDEARQLCREAIEKHLGEDALGRFEERREEVRERFDDFLDESGLRTSIEAVFSQLEEDEDESG